MGIPVEAELEFEILGVDIASELAPSAKGILTITIANTSGYEARDVLARISPIDPFSSTDETLYIGTLQAGESGAAKFKIKVDSDALAKKYAIDVEVKYWDADGNSYLSETMKATVEVKPDSGTSGGVIFLIIVIIAALAVGAYYVIRKRFYPKGHKA